MNSSYRELKFLLVGRTRTEGSNPKSQNARSGTGSTTQVHEASLELDSMSQFCVWKGGALKPGSTNRALGTKRQGMRNKTGIRPARGIPIFPGVSLQMAFFFFCGGWGKDGVLSV